MDIAHLMLERQNYRFTPEAEEAFRDYLTRRMQQPRFANGRSVRNALDRLRLRHANRLWEAMERDVAKLSKGDLITITAEDIRASRVFDFSNDPETS